LINALLKNLSELFFAQEESLSTCDALDGFCSQLLVFGIVFLNVLDTLLANQIQDLLRSTLGDNDAGEFLKPHDPLRLSLRVFGRSSLQIVQELSNLLLKVLGNVLEAMFSQRAFHPSGGDVLHCIGVAVEGAIGIRIVAAELLAKLEETLLGFLLDLLEVFIGDQAISCLAHL